MSNTDEVTFILNFDIILASVPRLIQDPEQSMYRSDENFKIYYDQ